MRVLPRPHRLLLPLLPLALAACGYTPAQLGITGPGTAHVDLPSHASEADTDAVNQPPGLPNGFGDKLAPSLVPTYGSNGRYFGYN